MIKRTFRKRSRQNKHIKVPDLIDLRLIMPDLNTIHKNKKKVDIDSMPLSKATLL